MCHRIFRNNYTISVLIIIQKFGQIISLFSRESVFMHGICPLCGFLFLWRACHTLTGWAHLSEMHDGILWWTRRVWINTVEFSELCCACIYVYVCVCVSGGGHQACLFVFTEAFYWSPRESFCFSYIQSYTHSIVILPVADFLASSFTPLLMLFRHHHWLSISLLPKPTQPLFSIIL